MTSYGDELIGTCVHLNFSFTIVDTLRRVKYSTLRRRRFSDIDFNEYRLPGGRALATPNKPHTKPSCVGISAVRRR